jgi:hypothetical protein
LRIVLVIVHDQNLILIIYGDKYRMHNIKELLKTEEYPEEHRRQRTEEMRINKKNRKEEQVTMDECLSKIIINE